MSEQPIRVTTSLTPSGPYWKIFTVSIWHPRVMDKIEIIGAYIRTSTGRISFFRHKLWHEVELRAAITYGHRKIIMKKNARENRQ